VHGLVLCLLAFLSGAPAVAAERVALVIGNGAYRNAPALANPADDARAMAAMLRRAGFDVLEGIDLEGGAMEDLLARFEDWARGAEATVAFYAGHGVQVDGRNYLLPVDARLEQKADLRRMVLADWLVEDAGRAGKLALVILDACRDNPLTRSLQARERGLGVGRGLAQIQDQPPNTLIAYATAADATAADGAGGNSPFTKALIEHLPTPGLEIGLALRKVRDAVIARTGGKQQPFTYGSLGGQEFYFMTKADEPTADEPNAAEARAEPAPAPAAVDYGGRDRTAFEVIRDSARARDFTVFLERFSASALAPFAESRLEELKERTTAELDPPKFPEVVPTAPSPRVAAPTPAEVEATLRFGREDWRRLQEALTVLGFGTRGVDGRPGQATREAITAWQSSKRQKATGYLADLQHDLLFAEARSARSAERESAFVEAHPAIEKGEDGTSVLGPQTSPESSSRSKLPTLDPVDKFAASRRLPLPSHRP
jgi:uncharacterized caspase-like protein